MEKQKAALVEALARKGLAMCRLYSINSATAKGGEGDGQSSTSITLDSIDNIWRDVLKFTDATDSKVSIQLSASLMFQTEKCVVGGSYKQRTSFFYCRALSKISYINR